VLASVGRLDAAREATEASLAIRRATGDRRGEGWMLERLARILEASGAGGDAVGCRVEARAIADALQDAALLGALERQEHSTNGGAQHSRED
jgi:hypothetical protein